VLNWRISVWEGCSLLLLTQRLTGKAAGNYEKTRHVGN
jgi:hypothetical protein